MKPNIRAFVRFFVLTLAFFSLATATQAGKPPPHRPPPKIAYTAIATVDAAAMTITVEPKNSTATGTKTYKFNAKTKIKVNGHDGTVADLQPGLQIHVGIGMDPDVADELSVTPPPADPK